jgi:hypothetical protein
VPASSRAPVRATRTAYRSTVRAASIPDRVEFDCTRYDGETGRIFPVDIQRDGRYHMCVEVTDVEEEFEMDWDLGA